MRIQNEYNFHPQTAARPAQPDASWQLAAGHALSLSARAIERRIAVTRGLLWLTYTAPAPSIASAGHSPAPAADACELDLPAADQDHWLTSGDSLVLPAGVSAVLEAGGTAGSLTAFQVLEAPRNCHTGVAASGAHEVLAGGRRPLLAVLRAAVNTGLPGLTAAARIRQCATKSALI